MTTQKNKICIIGAGCWGTALAHLLSNPQNDVTLVSATGRSLGEMRKTHRHPKLPSALSERIHFEEDIHDAAKDAEVVFIAVKSAQLKATSQKLRSLIPDIPVISLTKGLDSETGATMCEILEKRFSKVAALSGGSHAEEVIKGLPFTLTLGLPRKEIMVRGVSLQKYVLGLFSGTNAAIDVSFDRKGVELAAAVKNVIAIAAGIADGLKLGDNFRSSLITKGLSEMAFLGRKLGCQPETFYGYAGLGDLLATALSSHSRNRNFGLELGRGATTEEAKHSIGMVVEGLDALEGLKKLQEQHSIQLSLPRVISDIVSGKAPSSGITVLVRLDGTR